MLFFGILLLIVNLITFVWNAVALSPFVFVSALGIAFSLYIMYQAAQGRYGRY